MSDPAPATGQPPAAPPASHALEDTFGGIDRSSRPDLALSERAFRERAEEPEPKPEKPAPAGEEPAPRPADEAPPEGEGEEPAPAAAGKAGEAAEPGEPELAEDDVPEDLEGILSKYRTKRGLASAVRELRRLQKTTADGKKESEKRLDEIAQIFDEHFDPTDDGKFVLKPEAAARALQARRGQAGLPPGLPQERDVRQQVEQEFRADLAETVAEEDVDVVLKSQRIKARIDQTVKERIEQAKMKHKAWAIGVSAEVGNIVQKHLHEHPEDEKLMPVLDKIIERFPEQIRASVIAEGWIDLPELAEAYRIRQELPSLVKKAYHLGLKHGQKRVHPVDAGAPGKGGQGPRKGRADSESDRTFKEAILGAGILPSLDGALGR